MSELQQKNDADILTFVGEKREELRKIRFGVAGTNARNSHTVRNIRKDIARALTELQHRTKETA